MDDQNLETIRNAVHTILPGSEIILFGSRAREDFRTDSDYDIMVVVPYEVDMKKKMTLGTKIRKLLVKHDIATDIIIQSQKEVEIKKDFLGTVVREAVRQGVKI